MITFLAFEFKKKIKTINLCISFDHLKSPKRYLRHLKLYRKNC